MPTTSLPTTQNDGIIDRWRNSHILKFINILDLVLKVKIHGSTDPDFIEIEIPKWKLTYNNLLKICCEELEVMDCQVERIRKLPNTRLRKDSDVKRLKEFQALELVLKAPVAGDKSSNCYQSISTCKNQTILYWNLSYHGIGNSKISKTNHYNIFLSNFWAFSDFLKYTRCSVNDGPFFTERFI